MYVIFIFTTHAFNYCSIHLLHYVCNANFYICMWIFIYVFQFYIYMYFYILYFCHYTYLNIVTQQLHKHICFYVLSWVWLYVYSTLSLHMNYNLSHHYNYTSSAHYVHIHTCNCNYASSNASTVEERVFRLWASKASQLCTPHWRTWISGDTIIRATVRIHC